MTRSSNTSSITVNPIVLLFLDMDVVINDKEILLPRKLISPVTFLRFELRDEERTRVVVGGVVAKLKDVLVAMPIDGRYRDGGEW